MKKIGSKLNYNNNFAAQNKVKIPECTLNYNRIMEEQLWRECLFINEKIRNTNFGWMEWVIMWDTELQTFKFPP